MSWIDGIIGAPVTPFTPRGKVDLETAQRLADFLISSGVDAIALPMHIGESISLSMAERKNLTEATAEVVQGQVPLIVNVSVSGTDQAIELAHHAESKGAIAVVVLAPYHWRLDDTGLIEHFATIGRSIDIAMMVYNYPARLGVTLSPNLIVRLLDRLPNFRGLKDASLDIEYLTNVLRMATSHRSDFSVFTGVEYILPTVPLGAAGAFSALGAVAPRLVRRLYDATTSLEIDDARSAQFTASKLWSLLQVGYPAAIKSAMKLMGRPVGQPRMPVRALTAQEEKQLKAELDLLGISSTEPTGWQ